MLSSEHSLPSHTYKPKYLLTCLQNYYKEDSQMIEDLSNHILDNRQTKTYESIKHKN